MLKVSLFYFKNIIYVSVVITIAFFSAKYLSQFYPNILKPKIRLWIFFFGAGLLLVAAIGRLGWEIQTWATESPAEKLDQAIFWISSVTGTFLLIFDYCLSFFKN